MTTSSIHRLLDAARSAISGEVTSTSRAVDVLLDLRQAVAAQPGATALIDSILSAIPGRSIVTNEWWRDRLAEIEAEAHPSADPAPLVVAG